MLKKFYNIFQISAFIFSAQVGSGMFLLPALLSRGGFNSLIVLILVGLFAIFTIHVFADTGLGIKDIVARSFGKRISKIIYGIYWAMSWFSTIVLFKELSNYMGVSGREAFLIETIVFIVVTGVNLWKTKYTVFIESILSVLKTLPFFLIIVSYFSTESKQITTYEPMNLSMIMKCMWCFIGIETGSIIGRNLSISPQDKKIGTYIGMMGVVIVYLFSTYLSFKITGNESLFEHKSPYIIILNEGLVKFNFFFTIETFVRLFIIIVLIGSINSWTISSGYVAEECAEDKILPKIFGVKNKNLVPYMGIFLSSLLVYLVIITLQKWDSYELILRAIDVACYFFLVIYGLSLYSYAKKFSVNMVKKSLYYLLSLGYFVIFILGMFSYLKI